MYPKLTVCVENMHIFLRLPNEPGAAEFAGNYELFAKTEDHFHMGVSDFEITFLRNERGDVDRMEWLAAGNTTVFKRIP
jgi:hypothetical protein